jgi:sodium transport system permease protein
MLMLSGGSIVAVDAIIVSAKQLAIIVVGLTVAMVNILNLLVYLVLGVLELPENLTVALSALDLLLLLVLFVPLTVLVSSALLLLSGYAKSYKEYQIYFFPIFIIFLAPTLAGMLPGMDLRSVIAFVPVAGIGVAVREVMVGERDWLFLAVALLSSGGLAWWLARLTERALGTERLISGADLDEADLLGGPALFPKHVLRWFMVLWVIFFLISMWFGEDLGLTGQILVNLAGIFLGGSILMVRRYRLPVRETFALRPVRGAAWVAVMIGAPSGYVVGIGLATLVNAYLFPVPQDVIEAFGEVMLGNEMSLWQLLFFLTVLPGVLEELAFRGVLLHGLRKRLRPVGVCLVVGAIFGLFHVSLFRLVPTGYLGAVLAGVVLITGSIFPAMLWHGLNNALALVPAYYGWVGADSELPLWAYPLGVVGLLVCFAILWNVRTPYPDLKVRRSPESARTY